MMKYLVVAYPELSSADYGTIEDCRSKNDKLFYNIIRPHITLFFPEVVGEEELIPEVESAVNGISKIDFKMDRAIIHKDQLSENYYTFLLVSEGKKEIVNLHDRIYCRILNRYLKNEIPYVPHITIGTSHLKDEIKKIVEEWNNKSKMIRGSIEKISILKFESEKISLVSEISLK